MTIDERDLQIPLLETAKICSKGMMQINVKDLKQEYKAKTWQMKRVGHKHRMS